MGVFRNERLASDFVSAWLAAAAEATGDDWTIRDRWNSEAVVVLQEFESAKRNPDPTAVRGAVYCTASSRLDTAEQLFDCLRRGLWPLRGMKGCSSPEEAMLRFAVSGFGGESRRTAPA